MAHSQKRRPPRLSTPGEHGALVILGGSGALAGCVAPAPVPAVLAAAMAAIGYVARGPIERLARGFRARAWDRAAIVVYAMAATAAGLVVAQWSRAGALVAAAFAIAIPLAGAIVSAARVQRNLIVEMAGMATCGAVAGAGIYAGGATVTEAVGFAEAMATYGGATVLIVRAELRPLDDGGRARSSWLGLALLLAGAGASLAFSPLRPVAFAARGAHTLFRALAGPGSRPATTVALRESVELAVFVLAVVVLG